jgi:hypothetical protein
MNFSLTDPEIEDISMFRGVRVSFFLNGEQLEEIILDDLTVEHFLNDELMRKRRLISKTQIMMINRKRQKKIKYDRCNKR